MNVGDIQNYLADFNPKDVSAGVIAKSEVMDDDNDNENADNGDNDDDNGDDND